MPLGEHARRPPYRLFLVLGILIVVFIALGTLVDLQREASERRVGPGSAGAHGAAAPGQAGRCGEHPTVAVRELRGMWLTTVNNIDWPSQRGLDAETVRAEYRAWLDLAQQYNHNAIFVHVRPSGDALWPSAYAPWSEWLTGRRDGQDPGWDPMEFMITEAHARNLEFHAWMNPYRGAQPATVGGPGGDVNQLAPNHPLRTHPEWSVIYPVGTTGSRFYFDPGIPEARRFVEDSMLEAVSKYDVDGVHFDDFFYPYPEAGQDFDDNASFARYGQGFANKGDWRRDNVNTLVREMNERIKAIKPWVKFGISPFGIWRNSETDATGSATTGLQSFDAIYADTRTWVQEGWLDYIVPQLYWYIGFDKADYAKLLPWWTDVVAGTKVQLYIGQADWRVGEPGPWSDPGELDRQLNLNRQHKVSGSVHFSSKSIRDDKLGAASRYRAAYYAEPALVPPMAQLPANPPPAPEVVAVSRQDGGVAVSWRASSGDAAAFAVYRVEAAEAKLVGTVRSAGSAEQTWVDPTPGQATEYCVSALDRSWNEGNVSEPSTID